MAKDPAFLFYPGDYLQDTQCLSEAAQTSYDRIMCEHMRNIVISQDKLNFFTKRLNADQRSELLAVLVKVSGGFQIEWVAQSIAKRRNYSDSRRKNRSGKGTKSGKPYVPHMENGNVIENGNEKGSADESEKLAEYEKWTTDIHDGNDHVFQPMYMNEGLRLEPERYSFLVKDHFSLICRYPNMRPASQQAFRHSVLKHLRENKDKKINGTGSKNGQDGINAARADFAKRASQKPAGS